MGRDAEWMVLLAGAERIAAREGKGLTLRLLSARETLEARREAETLVKDGGERALCANACLLARALERAGSPLFCGGQAVLDGLSVEQIASLAGQWAEFNRRENPGPREGERTQRLKKAWSTRLPRAFGGVCSARLGRFQLRRGPKR